ALPSYLAVPHEHDRGKGHARPPRARPAHAGEAVTAVGTLAERTRSSDRIGRSTRPGRPNWLRAVSRQHGRPRPVSLVVAHGGLIDRGNRGDSRNLRRADTPRAIRRSLLRANRPRQPSQNPQPAAARHTCAPWGVASGPIAARSTSALPPLVRSGTAVPLGP